MMIGMMTAIVMPSDVDIAMTRDDGHRPTSSRTFSSLATRSARVFRLRVSRFCCGRREVRQYRSALEAASLGGYPILKKWLGYRQADRRDGKPLTDEERRWFRQIVQRAAALLALSPRLNALYQEAAANAFTADDLAINADPLATTQLGDDQISVPGLHQIEYSDSKHHYKYWWAQQTRTCDPLIKSHLSCVVSGC
jgi:hypothetical protein